MKVAISILTALALGWSLLVLLNAKVGTLFGADIAIMAKSDFWSLVAAQVLLIPCFLYLALKGRKADGDSSYPGDRA